MIQISDLTKPELDFINIMNDEFMFDLEKRPAYWVTQNKTNYKCPTCSKEMMIAGKINRDTTEERAEGKNVVQRYTCHGCLNKVIPVKI